MARIIDQINNLEGCIKEAEEAKGDQVYKICFPLEYDGLESFIRDCNWEITRLSKLNMMDNV